MTLQSWTLHLRRAAWRAGACAMALTAGAAWAYPYAYVEPGCPKANDVVSLWMVNRGNPYVYQSVTMQGNTVVVQAAPFTGGQQLDSYAPVSLGALPAGTYHVVINNGDLIVGTTFDFVVAAASVDVTGAWYNPAAPGFGFALYRGDRSFSGSYYTYRNDGSSKWYLLQGAYCTPTGYAGIFNEYTNNGTRADIQGSWTFNPQSSGQEGTFVEVFINTGTFPVFVVRPLTKLQ